MLLLKEGNLEINCILRLHTCVGPGYYCDGWVVRGLTHGAGDLFEPGQLSLAIPLWVGAVEYQFNWVPAKGKQHVWFICGWQVKLSRAISECFRLWGSWLSTNTDRHYSSLLSWEISCWSSVWEAIPASTSPRLPSFSLLKRLSVTCILLVMILPILECLHVNTAFASPSD